MRFLRIDPLAFKRLSLHVTYGMNISITTEQILNGYVKANEKKSNEEKRGDTTAKRAIEESREPNVSHFRQRN